MAGNIFHVEFGINETELTRALENKQYKKAEEIISNCINPTSLDEGCYQRTPLYITLCGINDNEMTTPRNFHLARLLIHQGANVNYRVPAIDFGSEYLAPGKSSLELLIDFYNALTLHPCHADGSLLSVQFEEEWNPMLDKVIGLNNKLLLQHDDVLDHITDLMLVILSNGGDVNIRDEYQMTPLHRTVIYSRDVNIVRLLCDSGAHLSATDFRGNTALAALCDAFPMGLKAFLEAKPFGDPYTDHNVITGREDILNYMLTFNMLDVDAQNKLGRTALFNCMVKGDMKNALVLLRHDCNPCLKGQVTEDEHKIRLVSPLLASLCSFRVVRRHIERYMAYEPRSYRFLTCLIDRGYFTREEIALELVDYMGEELAHLRLLGAPIIPKMFGGTTASLRQLCARKIFQSCFVHNFKPNAVLFPEDSPIRMSKLNLSDLEQPEGYCGYVSKLLNVPVLENLVEILNLPRDAVLWFEVELFRLRLCSHFLQCRWFDYYDDEIDGVYGNFYHSDEYPSDVDDSDLEYW